MVVVGLCDACDHQLRQAAWFLPLFSRNNDFGFEILVEEMCVLVVWGYDAVIWLQLKDFFFLILFKQNVTQLV